MFTSIPLGLLHVTEHVVVFLDGGYSIAASRLGRSARWRLFFFLLFAVSYSSHPHVKGVQFVGR